MANDWLGNRGPIDFGHMRGDMAIPEPVVCAPVPVDGQMQCQRGKARTMIQGRPVPTCDGLVVEVEEFGRKGLACQKCKLAHGTVAVNGKPHYGALL